MRPDMIRRLIEAGLSDKEARVYVAMLQLGPTGAGEISKRAAVSRATSYLALASLAEQGLATSYDDGRQTIFTPETPRRLTEMMERDVREREERHARMASFVPELEALFRDSAKPVVRYYEGTEGVRYLRDWIRSQRSSRFDSFIRLNHLLAEVARQDEARRLDLFRPDAVHRIIYIPDTEVETPRFTPEQARATQIRFSNRIPFDFDGEVGILDGSAYLASFDPQIHICVIESDGLSKLLRMQFEMAWLASNETRESIPPKPLL